MASDGETETYSGYIELMAFWISLTALHVYIFSHLCCYIARKHFVEAIIYMFQFLRVLLVAGSVIPAVVHCQIFALFPGLSSETFPPVVLGLMLVNFACAFLGRDMLVVLSCYFPTCQPPICDCPCKPKPCACPTPCGCNDVQLADIWDDPDKQASDGAGFTIGKPRKQPSPRHVAVESKRKRNVKKRK